jgi:cytoplasmic iron level regulating protein YaaA (DUF328/UPF0246 family)
VIVLLPPSESKRDGGDAHSVLDVDSLSFPSLAPQRRTALRALARLSRSVTESNVALGLGRTQRFEIDRNRSIRSSPTMPALDRYTGVLFDALDAGSLDGSAREWARRNVVVQSALFGLLRADDRIPAYRLSHDSRLADLRLARLWPDAEVAVLQELGGLILDLRSEAYVALGPTTGLQNAHYVRVVSAASDGTKRALNHFNKKGKGEFVRVLAQSGAELDTVDGVFEWGANNGVRLERGAAGIAGSEILLVV